ncbi:MAG: hypothetical protein KatS3mg019_1080 [Fimbriimonadales bacterium]|nr:MAG: hypothetical protein KatS3mg019_1080 [Fimbriimonadales bacterium]
MPLTRDDLKELPRLLQDDLELKVEIAEQILDDTVVARLMERNAHLRETFRRAVLSEALLQLPEQFKKFSEETTERFTRVEKDVAETKQRVERVEKDVAEIKQEFAEVKQGVSNLQAWQQGEAGRRAGEDYERKIVKRSARIFGIGEGGSPETSERVNQQVVQWLHQAGLLDGDYPEEDDPLDADLIWWKDNRVALAEISLKVDRYDVLRAKRRAEVLRRAGLKVLPVVIGNEWVHPETEQLAQQEGVAWRIGNAVSEDLIQFRKATDAS